MSNINPIATTTIAQGQQGLSASSSGVFANGIGGGGNFWDLILTQLNFSGESTGEQATPLQDSAKKNALLQQKGENSLALLQVALSSQNVDENGNVILASLDTKTLEEKLELTNRILDFMKNLLAEGKGEGEKKGIVETLLAKLQGRSDTLQASITTIENGVITKDTPVEDIPLPLLIALGLNPSEMTKVSQRLEELETKLGRKLTVEDLIAGVGNIIDPAAPTAVVAFTGTTKKNNTDVLSTIDENSAPTDDLAAQLNALDVGGKTPATNDDAAPELKLEPTTQKIDAIETKPDTKPEIEAKKSPTFKDDLVTLLNDAKSQNGKMVFPITYAGYDVDPALTQNYATPNLSFGSTAQSANLVSSSTVAGHPHPATQLIAANITKSVRDGANVMTVRLDPPELGNVNIRLQFGKDKTVKAHLTIEKPETLMMLQREGFNLERTLQSAGLQTGAESVTFELAQDNGAFGHDNNGKGGGEKNFGGGQSNLQDADGEQDIVQSSMTWHVDSSTGHVRYNIFV